MVHISRSQRDILRQRLFALASQRELFSEESIANQIERLLEEVLYNEPLPRPQPRLLDDPDDDQRVVITGIGLVSPFGIGIEPFWSGISRGRSAVRRITLCDPSPFPCQIAAEVPDWNPHQFLETKDARRMSRSSQFAVAAARLAVDDADLNLEALNRNDVGVLIACGATSFPDTEQAVQTMLSHNNMRVSPFYIPMALPNMPSCQVALHLDLRGYNSAICTACAASAQAIGEAAAIIRRGDAQVMLAGGAEAPISQISLAGFCAMRALSSRNDEPERASRPFDLQRDGFVPGEGAGVLVLERLSDARRRGATVYAEMIGYATTCDAYHVTAPEPQGAGAARAMQRALASAHVAPQQVDYINAHATGTIAGDIAETQAIKQAFDEYAYSVPISSTKSMIGHLTGAAGAVESAAALLAMQHALMPPTLNQEDADPRCDLDYIPNEARPGEVAIAMSNSFGFGGINAVLVFRSLTA
ncbi:MAG: beta-ketoacyl-ACP synthase II [Chloroflexaceae bacterium]|nr:beta-ketoacyl-ACP synthase II [Chloroflexaceae bacterium]